MIRFARAALAALFACSLLSACATRPGAPAPKAERPTPTILVSIDGFRADYLDLGVTPELSRLGRMGAQGAIRPSFPSKTFPNHYTLVTGLRPDHHGIVDNNMRDPQIPGVTFRLSDRGAVTDRRWWDDGEPIWVTAERAGRSTAIMFWPGSEAPVHGVRPTEWRAFDQGTPATARVDQVLAWLDAPAEKRPRFIALYFDAVDTAGHNYGPGSNQVKAALRDTDAALARLTEGLARAGVRANLVVVSDHGMAEISGARVIRLDEVVPPEAGETLTMGAFLTYYPAIGHEEQARAALLRPHDHMTCWAKGQIPAVHRYGTHRRVAPILCLPQTGWEIATTASLARRAVKGGDHGFDPAAPEMRALFLGVGPAFKPGVRTPLTDNVDVYPLLARLLDVQPRPNDGGQTLIEAALVR
ncbi:MAG TPA: ectonucleotide pyrophosphatase/phosphodiesterase [Phenylobacterium sp.]|uniref:alkaline phosphatase family protein n=1 Tax=Phenylobacterium sp. TaxID=1871053 RepID=UPI002F92D41E